MTDPESPTTVRLYDLLRRKVFDADGKPVGRISEFVTERRGESLRVTAVMVGAGSLLDRFGWTTREHGHKVSWEDIATLEPKITLRLGAGGRPDR